MIFTLGNVITIIITVCGLVLYRLWDRNNKSMEKVRKYAERCKDEIATYVEEKSQTVKNFGIDLDVETKAALSLMNNIRQLTEEDLVKKAEAIARIDEHIHTYDASLEELVEMTNRVQENLNRLRDESIFVENTGKKVSEAKEKFEQIGKSLDTVRKNLEGAEARLEKKNSESLEQTSHNFIASAQSIISDFEATAHVIERKIEEHREAITKIEREREANIAKDTELVKKVLKDAVENAGKRADKMEDAALVKLREQAQDRVNQLKTSLEEKIKTTHENIKSEHGAIQEKIKIIHDEYSGQVLDINAKLKSNRHEWTKEASEMESLLKKQHDELASSLGDIKKKTVTAVKQQHDELTAALNEIREKSNSAVKQQHDGIDTALAKQEENWKTLCKNTEQTIIAATEKRLADYSNMQTEAVKQLTSFADDAARLESELRLAMKESVSNVKKDFFVFEKESNDAIASVAAGFDAQSQSLRKELEEMDNELNGIKEQAFNNVSAKLTAFEDNFTGDLGKRSMEIGRKINDWQNDLERQLEQSADKYRQELQQTEENLAADQRKNITALGEKLTTELGRLKQEASAFEEGIREEMNQADETHQSFTGQIKQDLAEIRNTAENEVKFQIGQYHLSTQETLRQKQRELDKEFEELSARSDAMQSTLDETALNSRKVFDEWQSQYNTRMREMDTYLEELRRHGRETAAENDERIAGFRSSLEDIRRELGVQKKIFEHTGVLKQELEHHMEEINGDLDRLEQRKNEIKQLESQFTRIKRLEDEVNAKMTRFLSEKHRIEIMENDFNRLLKTSQAVEEKLAQVSTSDDILQTVQVQIRNLEDSIKETEEKYQRIERKKVILDTTNDSIDRNFKSLQETEAAIKNADQIIDTLSAQFENLRSSIEALAAENVKATEAADKIVILDESLAHIEKRIAEMNVAREWLARTETELNALDKNVRSQLHRTKSILEREGGKTAGSQGRSGAPPPQDRDSIKRLKHQGWTVEEIANSMGLSRGAVELVLELEERG